MVERRAWDAEAAGSSPATLTTLPVEPDGTAIAS